MTTPVDSTHTLPAIITIQASEGWANPQLLDLWIYRELIYFLTWREVKVRYKQTLFGAAWALLQPLLTMVMFSLFFGRLGKMPSDHIPYPMFALVGLVPWMFFSNGLTQAANSLVVNSNLITKVYFPRLALPISAVLSGSVDFLISFVLLVLLGIAYGILPNIHYLWLPPLLLLVAATALGTGFWLAALNVEYRDVRYTIPFLTQIWLFATPIAYPSSLVPPAWRMIYGLNPMVGVVEGFRWAITGANTHPGTVIGPSAIAALFLLISGILYFRRMEKGFADTV